MRERERGGGGVSVIVMSKIDEMRCCLTEQLLNQLDGAGPPPASKDQIDALPSTTIDQEQVGELIT